MGIVKKLAVGVGVVVGLVVLAGVGGYLWAGSATTTKLASTYDIKASTFPVPWPLSDEELGALRAERSAGVKKGADPLAGVDLNTLAMDAAVARGKHLVEARYVCVECHGVDFGGGTMIDDPAIGTILGPNLTTGTGSRTVKYEVADWDRMVRHGVKPDGHPGVMPSEDYFAMSDRELSDIVAYIRSKPAIDKTVPAPTFGPVGKVLVATGQFQFSADLHPTKHEGPHLALPPMAAANAEFGKHLVQVCTGCHRANLVGGPIVGGPPDWPPAANLTPAALVGWTYEDFLRAMREGKRKDGTALRDPMALMPKYAKNMTDTELQALWAYISTVPPVASVK